MNDATGRPCTKPDGHPEGLPDSLMRGISWTFRGGPYTSRDDLADALAEDNRGPDSAWAPDAPVTPAASLTVRLIPFNLFARPEHQVFEVVLIPVNASSPHGVTQLDVLWALQSLIDRTGPVSTDRCFEGLTLLRHRGDTPTPIYEVDIGT